MDYWGKLENVTEEAATQQVAIYASFPGAKRMEIAVNFFNFGVLGTREWIKRENPSYSELEITLAFVKLSFEAGEISQAHWDHFQQFMARKIRRDWAHRFRAMMKARGLDYEAVAKLAGFKNGQVVKATVTRGLPHFARLLVVLWEQEQVAKGR